MYLRQGQIENSNTVNLSARRFAWPHCLQENITRREAYAHARSSSIDCINQQTSRSFFSVACSSRLGPITKPSLGIPLQPGYQPATGEVFGHREFPSRNKIERKQPVKENRDELATVLTKIRAWQRERLSSSDLQASSIQSYVIKIHLHIYCYFRRKGRQLKRHIHGTLRNVHRGSTTTTTISACAVTYATPVGILGHEQTNVP